MRRVAIITLSAVAFAASSFVAVLPANAQTARAAQRRAARNARQLQRQVNRADYYTNRTWQQLRPWIQRNRVAPLARAAGAVRDTVRETVDAATAIGDGQFGYRDRDPRNTWFYDYYTYTPTYYSYDVEDRYSNAIRYFDADGDGVYDYRSSFRDSDNDGTYDSYDRTDFYSPNTTDLPKERSVARQHDSYFGPEDTRRYSVEGKIEITKKANVNGRENLIVGIKEDGQMVAIDVGPADAIRGRNVEVGATIAATGPKEMIGEKNVIIAERLRVNGKLIEIQRPHGTQVDGVVLDVKTTSVGDGDHYFAILESDGERHLVDLGPTTSYDMTLAPSTKVTVRGIPVRVQENRVLMATQVQVGGQTVTIKQGAATN